MKWTTIITLMLLVGCAMTTFPPTTQAQDATIAWSAPDSTAQGIPTPPASLSHYEVELAVDGGAFALIAVVPAESDLETELTHIVAVAYGRDYIARVRVFDQQNRSGGWRTSESYTPDVGAPGVPVAAVIRLTP